MLGSGKFAGDLHLPGLLHGKLRLSEYAHARVLAVDTSEAERLPGVRAVLTAWNTPEYCFGSDFDDQTLFARHKVLHRGAVLAVVAATNGHCRGSGTVYPGHLRTVAGSARCAGSHQARCAAPA